MNTNASRVVKVDLIEHADPSKLAEALSSTLTDPEHSEYEYRLTYQMGMNNELIFYSCLIEWLKPVEVSLPDEVVAAKKQIEEAMSTYITNLIKDSTRVS